MACYSTGPDSNTKLMLKELAMTSVGSAAVLQKVRKAVSPEVKR